MYCPACEKEFSPVHSRCPECKGWLRVSGPGNPVAAPARAAASAASLDTATTQKVPPLAGRPKSPTGPVSIPRPVPVPLHGAAESVETETPPVRVAMASASVTEVPNSRSSNREGPSSSWVAGGAATAFGGSAPAPSGPTTVPTWASAVPEAASGPVSKSPAGWGGAPAPVPAPSLSGPVMAPMAPPAAAGLGMGGGGWLGDGGAPHAYAPPSPRNSGWLGGEAPAPAAPPIALPVMPPADDPIALSDHTIAVDLGTPWEEEAPAGPSNRAIYAIIAGLILGLAIFSGYLVYQQKKLKAPLSGPEIAASPSVIPQGLENLKQGKSALLAGRWEQAHHYSETAYNLLASLEKASAADRQAVKKLYREATMGYARSLYDKSRQVYQKHGANEAIGLCQQSLALYAKLPGTAREQAEVQVREGDFCMQLRDYAGAISAYKKANNLDPKAKYEQLVAEARHAEQQGLVKEPVFVEVPVDPVPAEQPKVDGEPTYPEGHVGVYRRPARSTPQETIPDAVPVTSRKQPPTVYVPKKNPDVPSWRKRPSDVHPNYNRK